MDIREIAVRLNDALGETLVAALTASKDAKIAQAWAQQDGPSPSPVAGRRLQFAYTQWVAITEAEGEQVARLWFVSSNTWLNQITPIDAIRQDRFEETATAAAALIQDSFAG